MGSNKKNKQSGQSEKQKENNPPQKQVNLKVLFNLCIIKEKLINGLYIPKEENDYKTIKTDYAKPFIKIIDVFDKYLRQIGVVLVNAEIPNFASIKKFNENEISQFFNSDTYDLNKNMNNWNIELTITFNENLKKYNELKNVKDLKITYLIKEIPGVYTKTNISEAHLNFKNHCETSYPPTNIINIYSSFAEDLNNFISIKKQIVDLNVVYDFKNIIDSFPKLIDKITLNIETIPSPYSILQHIQSKNINPCDVKAIDNIFKKLFGFTSEDSSKIKDIHFNYYNNIHFGVLVALLLYYKNYIGTVMKYKIYNADQNEESSKVGRHEKTYDLTFQMKTFNIATLIDLLNDTTDIIDEDETTNEYYTPKYNKSFKYYIALLQHNAEIPKQNPSPKSYFKGDMEENKRLNNFNITYKPETITSEQFGFVSALLAIDFEKYNNLYESKFDLIQDIQFFMNNGIQNVSCSEYLMKNATLGVNSLIETSKNTISNISEKAGGLGFVTNFSSKLDDYSRNFSKSMDMIANALNETNNIPSFKLFINNNTPVLDIEYKEFKLKINKQPLDTSEYEKNIPIFFKVKLIKDDTLHIDDNLNEYVIKQIFNDTRAVISCNNKDGEKESSSSNNLFECIFYANTKQNIYENPQNVINIKNDTITTLKNIISENIGNYELNEYLKNYEIIKNNYKSINPNFKNNSITTFINKYLNLNSFKLIQNNINEINKFNQIRQFEKIVKYKANKLLSNEDYAKLLEGFKKFVTSDEYWGDNDAIQVFEKYYNIKIILFDLDYDKIVCNTKVLITVNPIPGQDVSSNKPSFEPTLMDYLFMSYYRNKDNNYIYNIIQFLPKAENEFIYKYDEIPNHIKENIILACSQNIDRPYSHYFKITPQSNVKQTSTSNLKKKIVKGGLNNMLPYGPFFINRKNIVKCDNFYEFLYKEFKKSNQTISLKLPTTTTPNEDSPSKDNDVVTLEDVVIEGLSPPETSLPSNNAEKNAGEVNDDSNVSAKNADATTANNAEEKGFVSNANKPTDNNVTDEINDVISKEEKQIQHTNDKNDVVPNTALDTAEENDFVTNANNPTDNNVTDDKNDVVPNTAVDTAEENVFISNDNVNTADNAEEKGFVSNANKPTDNNVTDEINDVVPNTALDTAEENVSEKKDDNAKEETQIQPTTTNFPILTIQDINNKKINKNETDKIQNILDDNYNVITNKNDGNCFFSAFLDSYNYTTIEQESIIPKIRNSLSKLFNNANFETYKNIYHDEPFMLGKNTLNQFQDYIKNNSYWADDWSINIIENKYNVKFIILNFNKDKVEIKIIENDTRAKSLTYIILDLINMTDEAGHVSSHYELINYKNNGQFAFKDLPDKVIDILITDYPNFSMEVKNKIDDDEYEKYIVETLDKSVQVFDPKLKEHGFVLATTTDPYNDNDKNKMIETIRKNLIKINDTVFNECITAYKFYGEKYNSTINYDFEKFKNIINEELFLDDPFIMYIIEIMYQVKFIIFKSGETKIKNLIKMIVEDNTRDKLLYIMLEFSDAPKSNDKNFSQYKLINYSGKSIFEYKHLPGIVRVRILSDYPNFSMEVNKNINYTSQEPQGPGTPTIEKQTIDTTTGIHIGGKVIHSLSGPVSFYYLRPKQGNEKLPLIILFGDKHRSKEQICGNCICPDKHCCYTISDPKFLQLIDTLADEKHPIDFYTETFLTGSKPESFAKGYMEDFTSTSKDIITCYGKTFKDSNENKCPTKNIRWQAGDPRQSYFKKSNFTFKNKLPEKIIYGNYIEGQLIYITDCIKEYLDSIIGLGLLTKDYYDSHYDLSKDYIYIHKESKNILKYFEISLFNDIDTYMNLFSYNKTTPNDKFIEKFFKFITKDNSLIYKQINKQYNPNFKQLEYWINIYNKISQFDNKYTYIQIDENDCNFIKNNIKFYADDNNYKNNYLITPNPYLDVERLHKMQDNFKNIIILNMTPFLDIYVLTRIFKNHHGGKFASLTFGYFGYQHVENIVYALTNSDLINNYDLVYSIDNLYARNENTNIRCLKIDYNLYLDHEIIKYSRSQNQVVTEYSNNNKNKTIKKKQL
jgi:hypothetical protein